jgi:hypothetical protein
MGFTSGGESSTLGGWSNGNWAASTEAALTGCTLCSTEEPKE